MKSIKALFSKTALLLLLAGTFSAEGGVILTTLASFDGTNGASPEAGLVQALNGQLYGTTAGGGASNVGTIFRVSPSDGALNSLAFFTGTNGAYPKAGLVQRPDSAFALYGTTSSGGASNLGVIFQITTNGILSAIASFRGTNGANPYAGLTAGEDGKFYGTTYYGGTNDWPNGYGVVFQVTTNGSLTPLTSFGNTNGAEPYASLQAAADGNFYGTTQLGGVAGYGTVFKISSAGLLTTLASFSGTNGAYPFGQLASGLDGNFYGTTLGGGSSSRGTVFRFSTNGVLTSLASFTGINGADPFAGLLLCSDGHFYGTTAQGGTNNLGVVFRLTTNGVLSTLVSFASTNGANPYGGLIQAWDGTLYGTTGNGGSYGLGTIYRLSLPLGPIVQTGSQNGNAIALSWNALIGQSYQVQYKTNLEQIVWDSWVNSIAATNSTMTLLDSIGPDPQRFYRVLLLP